MANYPDNIRCSKSHEYVIEENGVITVGITSYAADQLGEVVYVELPETDIELQKGESFSTIESVKAASEIYMPVSGKIIEVNDALSAEPERINDDCYYKGWIVKITDYDPKELENLISMDEYREYIDE